MPGRESKIEARWPIDRNEDSESDCTLSHSQWFGLPQRLALLGAVLVLEALAASTWLDTAALERKGDIARVIGQLGPGAVQWMVAFGALWLTFAWRAGMLKARSTEFEQAQFAYPLLLLHAGSLVIFGGLSSLLFRAQPPNFSIDLIAATWFVAGLLVIVLAAGAFVPLKLWFKLTRETRWAAAYAAVGALGALLVGMASHSLWRPAARLTFHVVGAILHPFLAGVTSDPSSTTIGTSSFSVMIAPQCSGIEGIGLMLIFGAAWLWFFRQECRFPQALLLIPAGIFLMWLLNAVRIAALILIGSAGAAGIAAGGFHSQAGWISFILVALGFCLALRRIPWLMQPEAGPAVEQPSWENPTAAYLTPFLAILAASMISGAASAGFEWLYPLRFFAAAAMIWYFRRAYIDLDWRFGWLAPAIGIVVLALWLGFDGAAGNHSASGIASGLSTLPPSGRIAWLVFRTLAAVVTVPIAEELAFRGFLIRRLITADFDSLDPRRYTSVAIAVSSIAFGLMHGDRWLAGAAAGLLYAIAYLWRGWIGDAVVAHATTNALLAGYVLVSGNWGFW